MSYCDFVAGWAAGISGILVGHPVDTVKVRQQTLGISSAIQVIKSTYKYEGFFSFYKGMLFPLISSGILNSVFFGVYGTTLRHLHQIYQKAPDNNTSPLSVSNYSLMKIFLGGCVGGFAQVFITCPVDLIKIKMQTETGKNVQLELRHGQHYKGSLECLRNIYHDTGIRGCYKGFSITLLRDIPSSGLYFMVYEKLLSWFTAGDQRAERVEFFATVFSGGVAGMVSWAAILPLDVIKSRIQADDVKNPTYSGMYDCFKKSLDAEGWKIFGRGFWVMTLRAFPVNAVSFLCYEAIICHVCRPNYITVEK